MTEDFKTFMSLSEPDIATEISRILTDGKILHNVHDSRKDFDPAFNNNSAGKDISIQLRPSDFRSAQKLIDEKIILNESDINPDHFLFVFTDAELKDLVKSADEWHPLDVKLAQHILQKRGIDLTQAQITEMHQARIAEISKPESPGNLEVVIGYIAGFMGGALGLFIAYYLINHKKTLPDGSQVYNYSEKDRKHGRYILIVSFISMLIAVALTLTKTFRPFD